MAPALRDPPGEHELHHAQSEPGVDSHTTPGPSLP